MRQKLAVLAGALSLIALTIMPASAIDVETGGRGGAAVTVGEATVDDDDVTIDRCECDGGPLERITIRVGGGTDEVAIDNIVGAVARTSDGETVGEVIRADNNTEDNAIVIIIEVADGALPVARIAVRRTAFYLDGSVIVIDTTMADLRQSIQSAVGAGA